MGPRATGRRMTSLYIRESTNGCCTACVKVRAPERRQHPMAAGLRRRLQSRWSGPPAAIHCQIARSSSRPSANTEASRAQTTSASGSRTSSTLPVNSAPHRALGEDAAANGFSSGQGVGEVRALVEDLGAGEVIAGDRDPDRQRIREEGQQHFLVRVVGVDALRQSGTSLRGGSVAEAGRSAIDTCEIVFCPVARSTISSSNKVPPSRSAVRRAAVIPAAVPPDAASRRPSCSAICSEAFGGARWRCESSA